MSAFPPAAPDAAGVALTAFYGTLSRAASAGAWAWRAARGTSPRDRAERRGRPTGWPTGAAWLHGASMGEVRALAPLAAALAARRPDWPVAVTTSTATGRALAASWGLPAALAPDDAAGPLARFLDTTRPRLHVVVETELWPVRLASLARRGIPAALVSARLSEARFPRYRRLAPLYRALLNRFALVAAGSPADRERLLALGLDERRLGPDGNLKWDAATGAVTPDEARALAHALGLSAGREWIVLGSVHPGEAGPLLAALRTEAPGGALPFGVVLAPRHPERFDDLAAEAAAAGLACHRASAGPAPPGAAGLLLDQMGALARLYPVARAALLGGTFVPVGGHSPLEAAAAACPQVAGPHVAQQAELVAPLAACGGLVQAADARAAARVLLRWSADPDSARRAGAAAAAECAARRGVAPRLAELVVGLAS